jgi:hypothetical protein
VALVSRSAVHWRLALVALGRRLVAVVSTVDCGGVLLTSISAGLEGWGSIGQKLGPALRAGTGNDDT